MARALSYPVKIYEFDGTPVYLTLKNVKRINYTFKPDRINVSAKPGTELSIIINFIEENRERFQEKLEKIKNRDQQIKALENQNITSFSKLLLFGKEYNIVYRSDINSIKLASKNVYIPEGYKELNLEFYKTYIDEFIQTELEKYIQNRLKYWYHKTGLKCKKFTIRKMKTLWGSCSVNKATIRFNFYLAMVPKKAIDYVIIHELCHLKEANHQAGFYNLLSKYFPSYKFEQKILKQKVLPCQYLF